MKKYNLSNIMKKAWEIKRKNSENLFPLCLKMAWKEAKEAAEMTVEKYLIEEKGLKVWEKGGHKRIYINDLSVVGIEKYTTNPKGFRKVSMYYDVNADEFIMYGVTPGRKETMRELIKGIRSFAN